MNTLSKLSKFDQFPLEKLVIPRLGLLALMPLLVYSFKKFSISSAITQSKLSKKQRLLRAKIFKFLKKQRLEEKHLRQLEGRLRKMYAAFLSGALPLTGMLMFILLLLGVLKKYSKTLKVSEKRVLKSGILVLILIVLYKVGDHIPTIWSCVYWFFIQISRELNNKPIYF
jgi:hypothetical protein